MPHFTKVIIGSRGSKLALWQAEFVKSELKKKYPEFQFEIKVIKTTGDKIINSPLSKIGASALFTKELEDALLVKEIDLIVHSLKDLPTEISPSFTIGAVLKREDPFDVFLSVSHSFKDLKVGAVIGTSSLRRRSQLKALRPELNFLDLRGNIDTRLKKMQNGDYDGIILAKAGLKRLGLLDDVKHEFNIDELIPSVGQGALALEIRNNDLELKEHLAFLDDRETRICVSVERDFLNALKGGCQVPIGAHCKIEDEKLKFYGFVGNIDGTEVIKKKFESNIDEYESLGAIAATAVKSEGAEEILKEVLQISKIGPLHGKSVVITQATSQNEKQVELVKMVGGTPLVYPVIEINRLMQEDEFKASFSKIDSYDYILFTSINSVEIFMEFFNLAKFDISILNNIQIIAIGKSSANRLVEYGLNDIHVPESFNQESILKLLPENLNGKKFLIPRAKTARNLLQQGLKGRGATVDIKVLYETVDFKGEREEIQNYDYITFTSPSCVNSFLKDKDILKDSCVVCIGDVTGNALEKQGVDNFLVASESSIESILDTILEHSNR